MRQFTVDEVVNVLTNKGYDIFRDGSPNLVGVRAANPVVNTFCDAMLDIRISPDGTSSIAQYIQTTDPGSYYLDHPMTPEGCGILTEGQHKGMWKLGQHTSADGTSYPCLVQAQPVTVIRDNRKDGTLDFNTGVTETGMFDIYCHRGRPNVIEITVDNWSALCQVQADGPRFDNEFMPAMMDAINKWGDSITYTLINEADFQ